MATTSYRRLCVVLALCGAFLGGCASRAESDRAAREVAAKKCRSGETYSCVERMGRPVRCFCADKDTLRELLEPTIE